MRSLFRLKYKLHRLVNMLFYLIFFAIGFMLGGGSFEKISNIICDFINKLNILCI